MRDAIDSTRAGTSSRSPFFILLCVVDGKKFDYLLDMPCPREVPCTDPAWIQMSRQGAISNQAVQLAFDVTSPIASVKALNCKK